MKDIIIKEALPEDEEARIACRKRRIKGFSKKNESQGRAGAHRGKGGVE